MMKIAIIIIMTFLVFSCTKKESEINTTPYKDSFFEKTRFIMTKDEINFYKHLPDLKAREEFQAEFWEKRDPTPGTEENENKIEFESRIEYANRWFHERGRKRGWDTLRGRIFLQLGHPDRREFGEAPLSSTSNKRTPMEIWIYYEHQLRLIFTDREGYGEFKLETYPATLLTALDKAKFSLDLRDQGKIKRSFRFEATGNKNGFQIKIPVKKISFEEKGDEMVADFEITVYLYYKYKKTDEFTKAKNLRQNKDQLLKSKSKFIQFEVPYEFQQKGKYFVDIIIEEKGTASKYRNFFSYKAD
jgi:GWxTD domain-containing protein